MPSFIEAAPNISLIWRWRIRSPRTAAPKHNIFSPKNDRVVYYPRTLLMYNYFFKIIKCFKLRETDKMTKTIRAGSATSDRMDCLLGGTKSLFLDSWTGWGGVGPAFLTDRSWGDLQFIFNSQTLLPLRSPGSFLLPSGDSCWGIQKALGYSPVVIQSVAGRITGTNNLPHSTI